MATRPFQEDSPIFPSLPAHFPHSPQSLLRRFLLLPIGRPFTGTHRVTIYRAFLISSHFIRSHVIFCFFPSRSWGRTGTPMNLALAFTHPLTSGSQCNYSSTQCPDTVYKGVIKNNLLVCENCGQVHDYLTANEYIDSYEYRHRIKRKSVYHRKYHIINVMDNIAQMNNIQIGYYNTENILRIFQLIDNVTHQPGVCRKRLIHSRKINIR